MVTVYVLQSLVSSIKYVGITEDLERRLKEHNQGKSKFTATYIPWKIIYSEVHQNYLDARKREKYLKSAAGKKFLYKLLNENSSSLPE